MNSSSKFEFQPLPYSYDVLTLEIHYSKYHKAYYDNFINAIKGSEMEAIEVWEHAYYLKYQNKRPAYLDAFWKVVNREVVAKRYENALYTVG
ncbi:MAG: Fe-Mn family superoxide dismutase [Bacteroidota bacterium]|nr:Fe-Mn family superoxide dismutase [Bacteroidota bacterium]